MHQSENTLPLEINKISIPFSEIKETTGDVEFIILPYYESLVSIPNEMLISELNNFFKTTKKTTTICILTSPIFASELCSQLGNDIYFKLWISIKLKTPIIRTGFLTEDHCALIILTKYSESLKHTKTRIGYTYCPNCDKTTKDYGGKKHLYHEFGTLMSDVWRDITMNFDEYPIEIVKRLADLFGIEKYKTINVYDQREYYLPTQKENIYFQYPKIEKYYSDNSILLNGDCLDELNSIPDNSIDFCFADPPYNLNKKYDNWNDGIDIQEYFKWCDNWLSELARVLKPGRTLAVLNIPLWCIRHFKFLKTILNYQDWIVWEGLSLPVRMIMPSHYAILCFSKGKPRELPGIVRNESFLFEQKVLETLKDDYCSRPKCISQRKIIKEQDTKFISNLWFDIHRLKHNSKRVDHPCQLPPKFMYRLISLFTYKDEFVLDPFNGAGTTSLTAQQLNRKYIGIELSEYYHNLTVQRHNELSNGLDPFRKIQIEKPKAKNSYVERIKKQKYKVSKKILQLEIKELSEQLGHIPSKDEVKILSKYPIKYFEDYFISWGEVTAAARTTGMVEIKNFKNNTQRKNNQQLQIFD